MSSYTLLVVEDEDAIRLTMRDFFVRKGYKVIPASDGVGAIKSMIDADGVDLIVTDYRMNILGGDYWIKFLQRFCPDIPVIVTSGFLRPDFSIPYEVMYKPFDYNELDDLIRQRLA